MKKSPSQAPKETKHDSSFITGVILIGVGIIFLLDNFLPSFDIGKLWPFFPIVIGAAMVMNSRKS